MIRGFDCRIDLNMILYLSTQAFGSESGSAWSVVILRGENEPEAYGRSAEPLRGLNSRLSRYAEALGAS